MIQLDEWVDGVSVHLGTAGSGNVPRLAVVFAVRQAVRKFCDESKIWTYQARHTLKQADTSYNKRHADNHYDIYLLHLPRESHIIHVWQVNECKCHCGRGKLGVSFDHPNVLRVPRGLLNASGSAVDGSEILDARISLSINQRAMECPPFIYHQHYDDILYGALAHLQGMAQREWANAEMAVYHQRLFDSAISQAKQKLEDGFRKPIVDRFVPANFM